MLDSIKVPVSQSALLVIDAQDSFKVGPRWERRSNPAFEKNVTTLIEAYRAARYRSCFSCIPTRMKGLLETARPSS